MGREADLARFRELHEAAGRGSGAVVAITGDHGVGKTRLAREAAALAERAGATTLWGQGYDDEGSPAYWPWTEVVTRCVERCGPGSARKLMGAGARDIAGLIPALGHLAPGHPSSREPPSHEARYRLFAAMRSFVQRAAAEAPLVLVFDDLHYCDPDTLRLFEAVAQDLEHSPVLLIGTYVERRAARHPVLPFVIAAVSKLPWYYEVPVGSLTEQDVRLLLEPEVGNKGSAALASSVLRQTAGNALFVVESVRAIARRAAAGERDLARDHWERGAADSIAMLINRRLGRLARPELAALQAAAALGREIDLGLVSAAIGVEPSAVRGLLAAPADDGLIAETAPDRYRFPHELVQRAVAAGLTPLARAALHRAAGEALEALRTQGQAVDSAHLAWHFSCAGTEHARRAAGYAREAGERALEAAAYDTALRHLEGAAAVAGLPPAERAELARLQAWTLFALTRFAEVAPRLGQAFDLYVSLGDIPHAVDAAAFDTYPQGAERLQRDPVRSLRERALALVPPDSPEAARLLCALAETLSYAHRERAAGCLSQAEALARGFADRRLQARIFYARAWMEYRNLDWPALLESGAAALEAARGLEDRNLELLFGGRLAIWRLLCGDPDGAEEITHALRRSGDVRSSLWTSDLEGAERLLAVWRGRWQQLARRHEEQQWLRSSGTVRGVARRPGSAVTYRTPERLLADIAARPQYYINPDRLAMRANEAADACVDQGNRSCLAAVREVAERALAMELSPLGRLFAQAALGFVGFLQQDSELIERACGPEMRAAPGDVIMESPGCLLDSVRGLIFGLAGRADQARLCFERALAFSHRCGLIWNIYSTSIYYAAFLARHGELRRARALADEARQAGAGLGLEGLERELAQVRSRLKGALPDGLTAREVEVLALAARGLATKQIASALDISYYTAVNHVRHIYAKTGAHCRVDLASYSLRHHLGGPGV